MTEAPNRNVTGARESWGPDIPDWVETLAMMSDQSSQRQAEKEIGYSGTGSVVNAVLKASYKGDLAAVEKAVRGRYMRMTVDCPVIGELAANLCLEHQKRALQFSMGSSHRIALARACRGKCPHSRIGRK